MRAAIVGGGAYAAGKRRAEAQQRETDEQARIAALEQQPQAAAGPAPAATGGQTDIVAKLKELTQMQDSGALTPEQFEAAKQKLLQGQ